DRRVGRHGCGGRNRRRRGRDGEAAGHLLQGERDGCAGLLTRWEHDLRPREARPSLARLHVAEEGVVDRPELRLERTRPRAETYGQDRKGRAARERRRDLGDDVLVVAVRPRGIVLAVGEKDDGSSTRPRREQGRSLL